MHTFSTLEDYSTKPKIQKRSLSLELLMHSFSYNNITSLRGTLRATNLVPSIGIP